MIVIKYSRSGIDLSGDQTDLRQLSSVLASSGAEELRIASETTSEQMDGYDGLLTTLRIQETNCPVEILRDGFELVITGERTKLRLLAESIDSLSNASITKGPAGVDLHLHIEHYPGHFFLSEASDALIVTLVTN